MSEEGADSAAEGGDSTTGESARTAVVLDYLPHGRSDDDRPQYQKSPIAQVLGVEGFGLFELVFADDESVAIGDEVSIDPPPDGVERVRRIDFDALSGGARSELEPVVRELLEADEDRLVEFYNEAGPITLRLHQLNLLPGIGDKLRDDILDARKRRPFESLVDLEDRISGLHKPEEIVVERVMEELRDVDVKYKLFARRDEA